jgi:hypothetical protein
MKSKKNYDRVLFFVFIKTRFSFFFLLGLEEFPYYRSKRYNRPPRSA